MTKNELMDVTGGVAFTSAVLNSIIKAVTTVYDIGRRVGSYVIRYNTNKLCSVD